MSKFFKPYEGKRPFLFISYAHKQSDAVLDTIRILHEKGWRLWYDEGIPAGSDWPSNIAQHMKDCERVVFFLSAKALKSPNCYSEMTAAFRQKKPILIVWLERPEQDAAQKDIPAWLKEIAPDKDWQSILGGRTEIPLLESGAERAEAILRSGFLPRSFHRRWTERVPWRTLGLVASLLLFLTAAGTLGALASGLWTPGQPPAPTPSVSLPPTLPPTVTIPGGAERYFAVKFPDSQQEAAIRRALEKQTEELYRWQLAEIPGLYFCGSLTPDSMEDLSFDADGTCRVNGAQVAQGQVSDLRLIKDMARLESLALVCQPLGDLSGLSGHVLLRELSLAGSHVDDLSALKELPSLETLHLEHSGVRDLRPLQALSNLKTVTVSRDMLPLTWDKRGGFAVVLIQES